ncbi:hypothetical protein ACFQXA_00085 [Nocardiopsis composta]
MKLFPITTVSLPPGEKLLTSNQRNHWRTRARITRDLRTATAWAAKGTAGSPGRCASPRSSTPRPTGGSTRTTTSRR